MSIQAKIEETQKQIQEKMAEAQQLEQAAQGIQQQLQKAIQDYNALVVRLNTLQEIAAEPQEGEVKKDEVILDAEPKAEGA